MRPSRIPVPTTVNKEIKSDIDCVISGIPSRNPPFDIDEIVRRAFEQLLFVADDIASYGEKDERRETVRE